LEQIPQGVRMLFAFTLIEAYLIDQDRIICPKIGTKSFLFSNLS